MLNDLELKEGENNTRDALEKLNTQQPSVVQDGKINNIYNVSGIGGNANIGTDGNGRLNELEIENEYLKKLLESKEQEIKTLKDEIRLLKKESNK